MNLNFFFSESSEWPVIATAIGTLALAIVAIFGGNLYRWYYRPRLRISFMNSPPDCQSIPLELSFIGKPGKQAKGYYYRLKIYNDGRGPAKQVEVFASSLLKKNENNNFEVVSSFIPMNLRWSHFEGWFAPAILPKMYRHCNLGKTPHPQKHPEIWGRWTVFFLTLHVIPNNGGERVPPGLYRLGLKVAAENIKKPIEATLEINNSGEWYEEEEEMLEKGIIIRQV